MLFRSADGSLSFDATELWFGTSIRRVGPTTPVTVAGHTGDGKRCAIELARHCAELAAEAEWERASDDVPADPVPFTIGACPWSTEYARRPLGDLDAFLAKEGMCAGQAQSSTVSAVITESIIVTLPAGSPTIVFQADARTGSAVGQCGGVWGRPAMDARLWRLTKATLLACAWRKVAPAGSTEWLTGLAADNAMRLLRTANSLGLNIGPYGEEPAPDVELYLERVGKADELNNWLVVE